MSAGPAGVHDTPRSRNEEAGRGNRKETREEEFWAVDGL